MITRREFLAGSALALASLPLFRVTNPHKPPKPTPTPPPTPPTPTPSGPALSLPFMLPATIPTP